MAGSELWVLVRWEHDSTEHGFAVKSIRSGKTKFFASRTQAGAEVKYEDDEHYATIAHNKITLVCNAEEYFDSVGEKTSAEDAGVLRLWQARLPDGRKIWFGTDENGAVMTNISINRAQLVIIPLQPSPPGPGLV